MERIVVIDHETHRLYVEDVSDEMLAKYNGEEEEYIKGNYKLDGMWSWDYITDAEYIPMYDGGTIEINFDDFL